MPAEGFHSSLKIRLIGVAFPVIAYKRIINFHWLFGFVTSESDDAVSRQGLK
jgi:hypothetical protein